jgi:hypothetical protein
MSGVSRSCSWCHQMNDVRSVPAPLCSNCHHRADVPRAECDCFACVATKLCVPFTVAGPPPDTTRVRGRGIRAGRLTASVTDYGVTRVIEDVEEPAFWLEIIESKERAIEVFKALWHHLTLEERAAFTMWTWAPDAPKQPSGK